MVERPGVERLKRCVAFVKPERNLHLILNPRYGFDYSYWQRHVHVAADLKTV